MFDPDYPCYAEEPAPKPRSLFGFAGWVAIAAVVVVAFGAAAYNAVAAPPEGEGNPVGATAWVMKEAGIARQILASNESLIVPEGVEILDGGLTAINPTRQPLEVIIDGDTVTLRPMGVVMMSPEICSHDCGNDCAQCWVEYHCESLKGCRWQCNTGCFPAWPGFPCEHSCFMVYDPDHPGPTAAIK